MVPRYDLDLILNPAGALHYTETIKSEEFEVELDAVSLKHRHVSLFLVTRAYD